MISTQNEFSAILDKFSKICPEQDKNDFIAMCKILEEPEKRLQRPWDIHSLYIHAMKIAKNLTLSEDVKLKKRFFVILKSFNDKTVFREPYPNITFNFTHIIDMLFRGTFEASFATEIVDSCNDLKVQEAAVALHLLMLEGLDTNFDINFLTARIQSPEAFCVIIRNEEHLIIASVLGTNLHLIDNTTVFHFNVLIRSPKYPLINVTHMLQEYERDLIQKFNPDFLSLCVDIDNPAKRIYERAGFIQISVEYNQTLKREAIFMMKNISDSETPPPSLNEIRNALKLIS